MKTFQSVIIVSLLAASISCEKDKSAPGNNNASLVKLKANTADYIDATTNPSATASDPFELGDIIVNGNKVEITVSYSGGCAPHTFEILWDEMIAKSNPPQINIAVIHDNNGDSCEAYITEVLSFELDSLVGDAIAGGVAIDGYSGWDNSDSAVYAGDSLAFNFTESETCNMVVTAKEAICGWGLYGNIWFALSDSVNAGVPDYYYNTFLQPVSVDASLAGFMPVPGKSYNIGAVIDKSGQGYSDEPVCMAYPGPSVPVKIMCISEVK